MKNLFKGQISNPIPAILELIPYTESVLDPIALDNIRLVLMNAGCNHTMVSNSLVVMLLSDLRSIGLIEMQEVTWPNRLGTLILLKRILDVK